MFSTTPSAACRHIDSQSDATSDSFSLRLTPSPLGNDEVNEDAADSCVNESGNDDDVVICHLVRLHDGAVG